MTNKQDKQLKELVDLSRGVAQYRTENRKMIDAARREGRETHTFH